MAPTNGGTHITPSHIIEEALRRPTREEEAEHEAQERAATQIQKAWRAKRRSGLLNPDFLWSDLLTHARLQVPYLFPLLSDPTSYIHIWDLGGKESLRKSPGCFGKAVSNRR